MTKKEAKKSKIPKGSKTAGGATKSKSKPRGKVKKNAKGKPKIPKAAKKKRCSHPTLKLAKGRKKAQSKGKSKTPRGGKDPAKNAQKYQRSFKDVALKIVGIGGGPSDVASACKVDVATVYRWLKKRPSFKEAFDQGEMQFEDDAESLYRKAVVDLARPHDVVSVKRREIDLEVEDDEVEVPAIETETLTKKAVVDVKGLADFIRRRMPGRYREGREIGTSDEFEKLTDWLIARNGGDNDDTED